MSIYNPIKSINKTKLRPKEQAQVEIGFQASPELKNRPADIMVIFDRSKSMSGDRMKFAKKGLIDLIDYVVDASNGIKDLKIGSGSRIALETFSNNAEIETRLTDNVTTLKTKVNRIMPYNKTNHSAAFKLAKTLVDKTSPNDKIAILFTDGDTTMGPDADPYAQELKQMGVELFCLGLVKDTAKLVKWASIPTEQHVISTTDMNELENLFKKVAYEVIKAGAYETVINEIVNSEFNIIKIDKVSHGTAQIINNNQIDWHIDVIGIKENEQASIVFTIENNVFINATKKLNSQIIYNDRDKNKLEFPNPNIELVYEEEQNPGENNSCKETQILTLEDKYITDLGRSIKIDIPIKKVCPNKKIALLVFLTEIDNNSVEHKRGIKHIFIDTKDFKQCEDILIKCINFSLPEELNNNNICSKRRFKVRIYKNNITNNFNHCCNNIVVVD